MTHDYQRNGTTSLFAALKSPAVGFTAAATVGTACGVHPLLKSIHAA
jgi:hypothetical protein